MILWTAVSGCSRAITPRPGRKGFGLCDVVRVRGSVPVLARLLFLLRAPSLRFPSPLVITQLSLWLDVCTSLFPAAAVVAVPQPRRNSSLTATSAVCLKRSATALTGSSPKTSSRSLATENRTIATNGAIQTPAPLHVPHKQFVPGANLAKFYVLRIDSQ